MGKDSRQSFGWIVGVGMTLEKSIPPFVNLVTLKSARVEDLWWREIRGTRIVFFKKLSMIGRLKLEIGNRFHEVH